MNDWDVIKTTVIGIEHHLNWKASVQCDVCRDVYSTGMWAFLTGEERMKLAADLRAAGWLVEGNHDRHVCQRCNIEKEDDHG